MAQRRVLFVDDEASIRLTLPAILRMHGYDVVSAGTVAEALAKMQDGRFDVLIADLNIGQPGDGFTVVSAMRRTQPEVVTIILTGYPAFESALEAIRNQVDDFIVKPAKTEELVRCIEEKLEHRTIHESLPAVRVAALLRMHMKEIVAAWLERVQTSPDLMAVPMHDLQRADHVPQVLHEMVAHLERSEDGVTPLSLDAAREHGRARYQQGYTPAMLMEEARLLRVTIMDCVQLHLLAVDISYLLGDLAAVDFVLDRMLQDSVMTYVAARDRAA